MASKRGAADAPNVRAMKQAKLSFRNESTANNQQRSQSSKSSSTSKQLNGRPVKDSTDENTKSPVDDAESTKQKEAKADTVAEPSSSNSRRLKVTDKVGDMFDAPPNSVLIHACNCIGSWGAGIAAAFKKNYPTAYKIHNAYCNSKKPDQLVGTAQLIPPAKGERHYVGCLFTSRRFGRNKDKPEMILKATGPAMEDLMRQIGKLMQEGKDVAEVRTCQINSGLFAVPWEDSKRAMEELDFDDENVPLEVIAYSRE